MVYYLIFYKSLQYKYITKLLYRVYLCFKDADVNIQDNDNNTPLHLAAYTGHDLMISILIDAQASIYMYCWRSTYFSACIFLNF